MPFSSDFHRKTASGNQWPSTTAWRPLVQAPHSPGNMWARHRCSGDSNSNQFKLPTRTAEVDCPSADGWKLPPRVLRAALTAGVNHSETLSVSTLVRPCRAPHTGGPVAPRCFYTTGQRRVDVLRGRWQVWKWPPVRVGPPCLLSRHVHHHRCNRVPRLMGARQNMSNGW